MSREGAATLLRPGESTPPVAEGFGDLPPIAQIVAGLAKEHGGPSYSVPALAAALARRGAAVRIRSVGETEVSTEEVSQKPTTMVYARASSIWGRATRASSGLAAAVNTDARDGAILHVHGLWLMPNIYGARAKQSAARPVPLVHSTRGMLSEAALRISAWKKRPFWWLMQRRALMAVDCLHATASAEADEIRAAGLSNPIAVIPNGVDLPVLRPRAVGQRQRTVLSLGRIHSKKGLDRLIAAWARIEARRPEWVLRIVGPSERNHDEELKALCRELGVTRVSIEAPLFDADRDEAYRDADLFVLSSRNENFGMAVAEALAAGTPVIATKGAPWGGMVDQRCGWWIDHDVDAIAAALDASMALPEAELRAMGARGRIWMARDFSWDAVAREMAAVYRWVSAGGEPPSTVRLS